MAVRKKPLPDVFLVSRLLAGLDMILHPAASCKGSRQIKKI